MWVTLVAVACCCSVVASDGGVASDPEVASMWKELDTAIDEGRPLALHSGSSNTTKFAMTPPIDCKGR